ncbi:hypothetical protein AADZ90_007820 [Aestuariibius sp. 2305UL40-4]|uniref:hypothetical protein n=1 Tax=Aestuariibius violaceus TaxID=3234132 RepID=UPI00345E805D
MKGWHCGFLYQSKSVTRNVMNHPECERVLNLLFDAFKDVERPEPLANRQGSQFPEEVDSFNNTDWDHATYSDFSEGADGATVCPARSKVYLLPRLFKIVLLRRSGAAKAQAVDNLSMELESWPIDEEVQQLLDTAQKAAIIAAWYYLDQHLYAPGGSHVGRALSHHWQMPP